MKQPSIIILIALTAALCFAAGYTIGAREYAVSSIARSLDKAPQTVEPAASPSERDTPELPPEPEPAPEPEPIVEETTQDQLFAERAASGLITFTDKQGRTLDAEVVEAGKGTLKVRRQADAEVLSLPVGMLSADDQAFATYLWEQAEAEKAAEATEEADLDEIFEKLFD